jgi:serine/threonine-protein kinase
MAIARLCQRCLAHDPEDRPSAREVADQLAAYGRPWWRGRVLVASAAALVAAIAVVVALSSWGSSPAPPVGGSTPSPTAAPPSSVDTPSPTSSTSPSPSSTSRSSASTSAATSAPRTTPPPTTASTPPPATVDQALNDVRGTIDAQNEQSLAPDIAQDLRNNVDNISRTLSMKPNADVQSMIAALRDKIRTRSTEQDAEGRPRMTTAARDALLASIGRLETSLRARSQ